MPPVMSDDDTPNQLDQDVLMTPHDDQIEQQHDDRSTVMSDDTHTDSATTTTALSVTTTTTNTGPVKDSPATEALFQDTHGHAHDPVVDSLSLMVRRNCS